MTGGGVGRGNTRVMEVVVEVIEVVVLVVLSSDGNIVGGYSAEKILSFNTVVVVVVNVAFLLLSLRQEVLNSLMLERGVMH